MYWSAGSGCSTSEFASGIMLPNDPRQSKVQPILPCSAAEVEGGHGALPWRSGVLPTVNPLSPRERQLRSCHVL
jgi:hypothetical protein